MDYGPIEQGCGGFGGFGEHHLTCCHSAWRENKIRSCFAQTILNRMLVPFTCHFYVNSLSLYRITTSYFFVFPDSTSTGSPSGHIKIQQNLGYSLDVAGRKQRYSGY